MRLHLPSFKRSQQQPDGKTAGGPSMVRWLGRKLVIASFFALALVFSVHLTDLAIGVFFPDTLADPQAMALAVRDIMAEPSAPPDQDLESLGFIPDDPLATPTHDLLGDNEEAGPSPVAANASAPAATNTSAPPTHTIAPPTATNKPATATSTSVPPSPSETPAAPLQGSPTSQGSATATGVTVANVTPIPVWDRKDRVNILLMGLDGNVSSGRYRRSDTIIVASIDPATKSAVMLSIPRDLFVTINGLSKPMRQKINTAYFWGEYYKYPGGGPALAMRTVGETLGIPIHHYVAIYFDGVVKVIDAIGGIDINVETAIRDNYTGWKFDKGMQHMNGERALQYSRSRYSTSDFSRARRQQQVLLAARDKVLKAEILPKVPGLLPTLATTFRTDLSVTDIVALGGLALQIEPGMIKNTLIDETMCSGFTTFDGQRVLLPNMTKVKALVKSAFTPSTPTPTPTLATTPSPTLAAAPATGTQTVLTMPGPGATVGTPIARATAPSAPPPPPVEAWRMEGAKIEVLNGARYQGIAARTRDYLQKLGLVVSGIGDADGGVYQQTILYDDGAKPATRAYLVQIMKIKPENIRPLPGGGPNLRLIVGRDWAVP